jgi:hypothetical protein
MMFDRFRESLHLDGWHYTNLALLPEGCLCRATNGRALKNWALMHRLHVED